jgi:hypothetical protein
MAGVLVASGLSADEKDQPRPALEKDQPRPGLREEGRPPDGPPRRDGNSMPPRRDGEGGPPPRREGDRPPPPRRDGEGPEGFRPPEGRPPFGPGRPDGPPPEGGPRRPDGPPGPHRGEGNPFGRLEQDDPEMFELVKKDHDLERQSHETAQRMRGMGRSDREKAKAELSEVVTKHFDVRQERRHLQIKRLEEEIKRLKDQIEARTKSRDELIKRRVAELAGDESDLGF